MVEHKNPTSRQADPNHCAGRDSRHGSRPDRRADSARSRRFGSTFGWPGPVRVADRQIIDWSAGVFRDFGSDTSTSFRPAIAPLTFIFLRYKCNHSGTVISSCGLFPLILFNGGILAERSATAAKTQEALNNPQPDWPVSIPIILENGVESAQIELDFRLNILNGGHRFSSLWNITADAIRPYLTVCCTTHTHHIYNRDNKVLD